MKCLREDCPNEAATDSNFCEGDRWRSSGVGVVSIDPDASASTRMEEETPTYAPGTFCWVECATSEGEAGKNFYTSLFGWDFVDNPIAPGVVYTMLKQNGKDIGGLYQLMPEMSAQGIHPHWLSYISIEDTDEAAAKVTNAGGTLLKEPFDIFTMGRMAVIQDPTGAVFALWQAGTHRGATILKMPNSLCWNELATTDTRKAGEFYSTVLGWTRRIQHVGAEYTSFINGERAAAGMVLLSPESHRQSHWLTYFGVIDLDTTVSKALACGARLVKAADGNAPSGRFAILLDPQGAAFGLIQIVNQPAEFSF